MEFNRHGMLLCIVGPSGSGKSSLCRQLLTDFSGQLVQSISSTTRKPRPGEESGRHYHFLSRKEFQAEIDQQLLFEWEEYSGELYGTRRSSVQLALDGKADVLLPIEIRGALHCKAAFPKETVIVFVAPPSRAAMEQRIRDRSSIEETDLRARMERMQQEFQTLLDGRAETPKEFLVDYFILNDDFEECRQDLSAVYRAERNRFVRIAGDGIKKWVRQWKVPGSGVAEA